jgi:hypothetical protein
MCCLNASATSRSFSVAVSSIAIIGAQFDRPADHFVPDLDSAANLEIGLLVKVFKKRLAESGVSESQKYANHRASSRSTVRADTDANRKIAEDNGNWAVSSILLNRNE